ncbi:cupin domain-containing protein [Vibrio sp. NTOU-M3]|uniref:cupin domain-containing protein n=1 Tax=Vibrio sp. NTOU-M3 TaxID=3234954 RepID=UPI00349FA78A
MREVINLKGKFNLFNEHWSPKVVGELNDYQIKIAKFKGEFIWHSHSETDELFLVVSGKMKLALPDETVDLAEGDLYVVKKGVEHKPIAEEECHIMMIEPRGTLNTGDDVNDRTAENDIWI